MLQEQSLQLQIKSLWRSNMKEGGGGRTFDEGE